MKYPKIVKNCKLENIFEESLKNNVLNSLQRENSLINYYYKNNVDYKTQNENVRLIDESILGTISLFMQNLLSKFLSNYLFFNYRSRANIELYK